ncbi:hypothetical protein MUGA111182_19925 [Mucilaginibacter galii]
MTHATRVRQQRGWVFEMNISPDGSLMNKNNAIQWIRFYSYNF